MSETAQKRETRSQSMRGSRGGANSEVPLGACWCDRRRWRAPPAPHETPMKRVVASLASLRKLDRAPSHHRTHLRAIASVSRCTRPRAAHSPTCSVNFSLQALSSELSCAILRSHASYTANTSSVNASPKSQYCRNKGAPLSIDVCARI